MRVTEVINGMEKSLLDQGRIDFIDGVGQRNGATAGRLSTILWRTFIDHNNFAELPVIWSCAG